uniref:DUF3782 domain-containing protein n=1 Tax=Candidatus Kentrum sp. UNK TaxID=2126344 RepID=A0A451AZV9_9GAMM|nr:MAG: Protein of unknown function DUF91 [Candidatus Kentron sp. UNK]VFK71547.1 MAG: Protein of unknown function DUF91 [Candidatus Kentron sp. UNK]
MNAITYEEVLSLFRKTENLIEKYAKEADRRAEKADHRSEEAARRSEELDRRFEKTERMIDKQSRQIKEQGRQIGGIGDKFGYFTEGLALPSMERILIERFGMTSIMPRVRNRKNGEEIEIDVLATANDEINLAMVVEVKSRVRMDAIEQLRKLIERFRDLYPEHRNKEVMGILTGIDWDWGVADKAREAGLLTASIRDEMFRLTVPQDFEAQRW